MTLKASDVQKALRQKGNTEKAKFLMRFFKTGKGQYAEGDKFLGLTVPETRKVVAQFKYLPLSEVVKLLHSPWHEERLCALLIIVEQFEHSDSSTQQKIFNIYLKNTKYVNNWDLVDSSAEYIVGPFLMNKPKTILYKLAKSQKLFERRIAIIATLHYIQLGDAKETFKIADMLMRDKEDLIHKAVGWMLREVGKRISKKTLVAYLALRYNKMPRTMLRYAIEHFDQKERYSYLKGLVK